MSAWRARLGVLLIFLIGFTCGVASLHLYRLRVENRLFKSPDVFAQLLIYKLDQDLDLTEQQKTQIRTTILNARSEILGMSDQIMPQILSIFDRYQGRIRETLTPEQQKRFDEIVAERKRMLKDIQESIPVRRSP